MSNVVGETCFDPRTLREPHACPGRCACYVNHWCNPGCVCTSCQPDKHVRAASHVRVALIAARQAAGAWAGREGHVCVARNALEDQETGNGR